MIALLSLAAMAVPQADSAFVLVAERLADEPTIDGVVEEREWEGAAVASGFLQYQPQRGERESQHTEVLFAYDERTVYIAFRLSDDEKPTAQLTRRDADLWEDDVAAVVLDTHGDRQSAYYFLTNPLGTQSDGRIADDGRTTDSSWDGTWRVAAERTAYGWSAEFAIPLSSLTFAGGSQVAWGINFGRGRRSNLEQSFWAGPLDNLYRISQAARLEGLQVEAQTRRAELIPYGLTQLTQGASASWDAGLDARYALRPDVLLQGTLNPDFATIEADRELINLTRFELSLPEKRPFFLEGSELFRQRIQTFYSRRIADIRGGVKLNGRSGPWTTALAWANEDPRADTAAAHYGVARLQRSVLGRSNVAVMVADRLRDAAHQGSVSVDATLFFTSTLGFTGQWVESYGPFDRGARAFFVRPSYDSPTGHFHVRYTHLGENFVENANAVGFIRDDDRRELDSAVSKTLFFRSGAVERMAYDSNYNVYWSQAGTLRAWEVVEGLSLDLRNRLSLEVGHTEDMQRFEKEFRNRATEVTVGYNTREFESVSAGFQFGHSFDSDFRVWTAGVAQKPTARLSLEYELERLTLDPDPEQESTWIHVLRTDYFFTPDLFLRGFFQTNSILDRESVQVTFVWRYLPPFGTVQVAFQRGETGFGASSVQGNALFVKATTVF